MQTVLVVDDDRSICDAICAELRRHLAQWGDVRLSRAYSGLDTLSIVEDLRPSVIVIDLGLPDVNGLKVIRRLRHHPLFQQTRIILLAPQRDLDLIDDEDMSFVEEVVARPAKLSALAETIGKYLQVAPSSSAS